VLTFAGDSDAHIVRGLIAILFAIYSGKSAREILNTDAVKLFEVTHPGHRFMLATLDCRPSASHPNGVAGDSRP
jgi:hypothetical protein